MLRTLVLGHGRVYKKEDIRCSPIDVDEWYNDPFISVDDLEEIEPDILYRLERDRRWTFAKDNSYDRIIDCTGGALLYHINHIKPLEDNQSLRFFFRNSTYISALWGFLRY